MTASVSSTDLSQQVLALLTAHISPLNARSILQKARERVGAVDRLTREQMGALAVALLPGTRLFIGEAADSVCSSVAALGNGSLSSAPRTASLIDIVIENDISIARRAAQQECQQMGASAYAVQRVITIVSELARNIFSYSRGGQVEIVPGIGTLKIIATDKGPGIKNLDEIMSGAYRSKTGLGKGIVGTKRLASKFDIMTGPAGTRIVAEVTL